MKSNQQLIPLELTRTFVSYCDHANIVQAAKELGISPGAVTGHLQRLEDFLPAKPFMNQGRRKLLTSYGRALFEALQVELTNLNRSFERVNQLYCDPEKLILRIGCRREIMPRIVTKLKFSGRSIYLPMNHDEMMKKLIDREIDVAISHSKLDSNEIMARKIFEEGAKIITSTRFFETLGWKNRVIGLEDVTGKMFLQSIPCIVYKKSAPLLKPLLEAAGISLSAVQIKVICEDWMGIVRLVEEENGYSVIPDGISLFIEKISNIYQIEIPANLVPPMTFYAIFPKDLLMIPAYASALSF